MRNASPNSRRTSALPTSRIERVRSRYMPISQLNEPNAHTKRWLARAQREVLRNRAQFKARNTMFGG
jgi:hypothetical protein